MSLVLRTHEADGIRSRALYSPCMNYRYRLERHRRGGRGTLLYIMLNPSTATEAGDDPTVARCARRAERLGFGGFVVCNIFAWRETAPARLKRVADPVGPMNDAVLVEAARAADLVLCAWGVHGAHRGRGPAVARMLREAGIRLHHLGLTRNGHPRHPLYLPYDLPPRPWRTDDGKGA